LFEEIPEFEAAFDDVLQNGFFGDVRLSVTAPGDKLIVLSFSATGFIPNNLKYTVQGCGQWVNIFIR